MLARSVLLALLAASLSCGASLPRPRGTPITAIVDVTVVTMLEDNVAHPRSTVLVQDGLITEVGPAERVAIPDGATRIEGAGRYLVPGLADMHVHLPGDDAPPAALERILDLSLAHGITVIRGMQGAASQLAARARLRASGHPAPRLVLAGPPMSPPLTPAEGRARVREQQQAGYDEIKILGRIDTATYDAIVDEARTVGMRVSGHVPATIGLEAALRARQATIEHAMGYEAAQSDAALDALAVRTREAGIRNCPTLHFFAVPIAEATAPAGAPLATPDELARGPAALGAAEALALRRRVVAALARARAPLLVGSDAPGTFSVPGFAYAEELQQLCAAGLRPYDALLAATREAAAYLGESARTGAIAKGMRADLVLLDGNPLDNIAHVARPAGVMLGGRWSGRRDLDALIARHRAR